MEYRKNTGRKAGHFLTAEHAFFFTEASSFIGGPAGYLNGRIADLEHQIEAAGGKGPFGVMFMGGDGKTQAVILQVFEA